jgi:hypothetical protein
MLNQRKIIFEKFASIFGNYTLSEAKKIYQDVLIKRKRVKVRVIVD